jgi:hypothetical protein
MAAESPMPLVPPTIRILLFNDFGGISDATKVSSRPGTDNHFNCHITGTDMS